MITYSREQLIELLYTGKCTVEFTKVNGETRTMNCTLKSDLFTPPVVIDPLTPSNKKINLDVISVWCFDNKAWRSFRVANVISAKAIE
jgi:hypothetical protein